MGRIKYGCYTYMHSQKSHHANISTENFVKQVWATNKTTKTMERGNKYRNCELRSDIQNSFLLYNKQSFYCFSIQNIAWNFES
jgi:hypothetical protein